MPAKRMQERRASPHQLVVQLSQEHLRQISLAASRRGLEPAQLAGSWLQANLALAGCDGDPSADGFDIAGLAEQIGEVERALLQHEAQLATIERLLSLQGVGPNSPGRTTPGRASRRRNDLAGSERSSRMQIDRGSKYASGAAPRTISLHDEIVDILKKSGGPMSAGDIAEAVCRRGRYKAPRSDKPVSGATISSRVSNPVYRDLFRHANRRITLAD